MTKAEIDKTIKFLIKAKKAGQFRAFWKDFDESVNLMASGEVVIQSMWSPAVTAVRSQGHRLQLPAAQGRLSRLGRRPRPRRRTCRARKLDARLRVHQLVPVGLGRRLPQPPGLLLGGARDRQGQHGRPTSGATGWKASPPQGDIKAPDGNVMEKAGAVRDGGSFYERMGTVACWNAVMDEDRYMVQQVERVHRGLSDRRRRHGHRVTGGRTRSVDAPLPRRARAARAPAAASVAVLISRSRRWRWSSLLFFGRADR